MVAHSTLGAIGSSAPTPVMIVPTSSAAVALYISNIDPFAHLSLVSSHNARELIICTFVIIGSLSVFIWDILCHLRDDYNILSKHRITLPTCVYFFSRLFALLYLIAYTIIQTTPVGHCNIAIHLASSPLVIALPASEFLLFLHLRAIYATKRIVVGFFALLWLSTLVSATIAVITISGMSIGPTNYCTPVTLARVNISTIIIPLVNDTLLFMALVARIMDTSSQDASTTPLKDRFKTALFGASTPRLAKTLLQNGQQYFLATVIVNLAALVMYCTDDGNPSLAFPSVMIMNLMASRLYRKTKLTRYDELDVSFKQSHGLPLSIAFAPGTSRTGEESVVLDSRASGSMTGTAHSAEKSLGGGSPRKLSDESRI